MICKEITKIVAENKIKLYALKEDDVGRPFINYSLVVKEDLHFSMWCNEVEISPTKVAQHCKQEKVDSFVGVLNILAHLKRIAEDTALLSTNTVQYCTYLLEKITPELQEDVAKKVGFLNEQLKLSIVNKMARRYTPDLLSCTVIWKNMSPALYNQIWAEGILTIPAPKYLDHLTSAFKVEGGTVTGDVPETTKQYLKSRFSSLNERQKLVNLMLDEVYTCKRVEYSSGKFYGYENQTVTTTLLGFMIKSVAGKFHEMVTLVPIAKINADVIDIIWRKILEVRKYIFLISWN